MTGREKAIRTSELLGKFFDSKPPEKIVGIISGLKDQLCHDGFPVLDVVPLLSLQGEWAVKALVRNDKGYGDVDWGVIVDSPTPDPELYEKISRRGTDYICSQGEIPCPEVNPKLYHLNLSVMGDLLAELPSLCDRYMIGDTGSYQEVVCAALPLLSLDRQIADQYRQRLLSHYSIEEFNEVWSTLVFCANWMRNIKPKSRIGEETARHLNSLRAEGVLEKSTEAKSYGLMVLKPTGMEDDTASIIKFLLGSDKTADYNDEVLFSVTTGMTDEQKDFFTKSLPSIRIRRSFYGNYADQDSFWLTTYQFRHSQKYWYSDLMRNVNRGTLQAFLIESQLPQEALDRWIDLFKGKENIVTNTDNGEQSVVKQGRGLRGMYDSQAVMIDKNSLDEYLQVMDPELAKDTRAKLGANPDDSILFTKLPKSIDGQVWQSLPKNTRDMMLGNSVHATGNIRETLEGVVSLALPLIGYDGISSLLGDLEDPQEAIQTIIDVYELIETNNASRTR